MTTQPIDIKALRKLAESMSPNFSGPWNMAGGRTTVVNRPVEVISVCHPNGPWECIQVNGGMRDLAEYITAANPATMLTLLDALETAAEALRFYSEDKNYSEEGIPGKLFRAASTPDEPGECHWSHDDGQTARAALSQLAELGVG